MTTTREHDGGGRGGVFVALHIYRGTRIIGVYQSLESAKTGCETDAKEFVGEGWRKFADWIGDDKNQVLDFDYYSYDVSRMEVQP